MAKRASVTLEANELQQIKSFYEQERIQLAARLQHIDEVLARLGGGRKRISDAGAVPAAEVVAAPAPKKRGPGRPKKSETVAAAPAKKAGRPKKRGPKSVWGNFILRRLRQCDRPLSYAELIRDAMVLHNLPAEKEKNAKASVLNAAFRLRNTLKKVDTIGLPGKKEKFLVLSSWIESEGKLKAPYQDMFTALASTPMGDRGRKPRRPSSASATESKVKARMATSSAKPAAKKAAPARKTAAKPAAKKAAPARKAAAKPAAKKAAPARKAAAKPAAKKAAPARKAAAKPAAKKAAPARKRVAKKK